MSNSISSKARFIAVVGPSGVGKDSVMDAMIVAKPRLHRVRRVITRAADAGGEVFDAVTDAEFAKHMAAGEFALHWTAHGLSYGIPTNVRETLGAGRDVLANLSRGMLAQADQVFEDLVVLNITATSAVLERRLAERGRESSEDISKRLARPAPALPTGLTINTIDNSGDLSAGVQTALNALYPDRG